MLVFRALVPCTLAVDIRSVPSASIVPSAVDVVSPRRGTLPSSDREPALALAEFAEALAALRAESGPESFDGAAKLLHKIFSNVAEDVDEERFRRLRCTGKAFERHIGQFESGQACLRAVGFRRDTSADGVAQFVLPRSEAERSLLSAAAARLRGELRMREVQLKWPAALQSVLPAAATGLALRPSLFEQLTAELTAPHMSALLETGDNIQRVSDHLLRGEEMASALLTQLREVRKNVTASERANPSPAPTKHRVHKVSTTEEWYDLLLDSPGLVVAYFGAAWCQPCQLVKPLYKALSAEPRFSSVTFVQVDADELPTVASECEVAKLPTFKFFRDSAEEGLPVEGADIQHLEKRIAEMMVVA